MTFVRERPSRITFAVSLAAALVALLLPARGAWAQDKQAQVTVAVSRESVDLGDSFIFQVSVDGASSAEERTLPDSPAYKSEYLGGRDESSRSIFTVNGRTTDTSTLRYVMQWRVTPLKTGPGTIEPFQIKVGSQTLNVPRVEFTASEPGANPNFQLTLEPQSALAYVGEPVRVRMTWVLGRNVKGAAFSGNDGGTDYDVLPIDPRPPKARTATVQNSDPYRIVPFLAGQFVITRTQVTRDDKQTAAFTADLVITPRRPGKLEVGPFRVAFDEVVGQKQRGFFDSPFEDLSQTRRAVIASNTVTLDVKPLPEEGRPADFAGLIGSYSLEASAANSEANVGDPIPLTLTIRGPEPLNVLKAPPLDSQPDLASRFKSAPEGWESAPDAAPGGQRTFSTTIRPKADSVTEIPAIRLPYFDTKTGKYDVALSKPIPLKVHPSREITLADALRPSSSNSGPQLPVATEHAKLTDAPVGIGANSESASALIDQRVNVLAMVQSPVGVAFVALPPAALAMLGLLAHRRRSRDPQIAARRAAIAHARRTLAVANSPTDIALALRTALAPFLRIPAHAVTSTDASSIALPGDTASSAADLLGALESATFDSTPIDLAAAKSRGKSLLEALHKA